MAPNNRLTLAAAECRCDSFLGATKAQIHDWIADNVEELHTLMEQRFRFSMIVNKQLLSPPPSYMENYSEVDPSRVRKMFLDPHRVTSPHSIAIVRYWLYYYIRGRGNSCNELLFGETQNVELFGMAKQFILGFRNIQDTAAQKDFIASLLPKTPSEKYLNCVFHSRVVEAMHTAGYWSACTFAFVDRGQASLNDVIRKFFQLTDSNSEEVRNMGFTRYLFRLMLLACCLTTGLPADYFLLPDYSKFATLDGKPLSIADRTALSAFLLTTEERRADALAQFVWNAART